MTRRSLSPQPPPRRSGRSMTEAERADAGRERINVRPRAGTKSAIAELADCWSCSRTEAVERAVHEALWNAHGADTPLDESRHVMRGERESSHEAAHSGAASYETPPSKQKRSEEP